MSLTKDGLHQRFLKDFANILYNPLWLVIIFRAPILENTSWWLLLYVLEALLFQNTSKWLLVSSLSKRAIFFLETFLFREPPKKTSAFSLTSMMTENSSITFHHVFMVTFYVDTLQKLLSHIYLGKYLTNSVRNWPEGKTWLRNYFSTLKNLKKVWRHG